MSIITLLAPGMGFAGLLISCFILLKEMGVIKWSWWWVFSPLWTVGVITIIYNLIPWIIS